MNKKWFHLIGPFVIAGSILTYPNFNVSAATNDDITGIALEKEMRAMIELEVIYGYTEGVYKPSKEVTRGEFAAFLSRALKLPEGTPAFTDVPSGSVLASDIYKVSSAKIVNGYGDGTFRMDNLITREQMIAMIDNALTNYLKVDRTPTELTFNDVSQINPNFQMAVAHTVQDEIISGFTSEDGTMAFQPKKTATRAEAAAFISRMLTAAGKGAVEEPPVVEKPAEEIPSYNVATIDANKNLVPGSVSYATYDAAKNAVAANSNQVVTFGGKIINMSAGLVISDPPAGQSLTYIYADENFATSLTYVNAQQEMEYLESTDKYVKVNIAGRTAFVKPSEVSLLPYQQVEKRNYYSVNSSGDLVHTVYNQKTNSSPSYIAGKAPSFLAAGQQYYSWDGIVFYNTASQSVGTAYQYFNYLPARTVTNYSAAELDQFINFMLADRQALYDSDPVKYVRYKDVTTVSKLKGLGTNLKAAEAEYRINALLILAIAFNESDYGMSTIAQTKNNLFGLNAVDSNVGLAYTFASPAESIVGLATKTINGKYLDLARPFYANGAALGNKAIGMNVRYASDPYWGQKNAGYMYRADKYLGGKDLGKYQLGLTNTTNLNVRSEPNASSTKYLTYAKSGMPVAIMGSAANPDGSTWYQVVSENINYTEAYIRADYVNPINIVK